MAPESLTTEDETYVVSPSLEARAELIRYLDNEANAEYGHKHAVKVVDLIDALIVARVRDALTALDQNKP